MNDASINSSPVVRWLAKLAPLLIALVAVAYYGSYIGYWFNPHDEGGTAALTAMRLLNGEAPIRDVELGYNVGWFWPIVALFKMVGVNFVAMRGYFFALSTLTALLGWNLVRKLTRNEMLALGVGVALVIFPGSQFKNYIPLLCVANTLCVAAAAVANSAPDREYWWRVAIGGVVLGITLLIRIDLGYLLALLWVGFFLLRLLDGRTAFKQRALELLAALAILFAGVAVIHGPAYFAAKQGGYDTQFVGQYERWFRNITGRAGAVVATENTASPKQAATVPMTRMDRSTLSRVSWATARSFKEGEKSVLFALTYLPALIYALLFAWAAGQIVASLRSKTFSVEQPGSLILIVLIGSLATFPQFFFFRPDRPHLSEFMPGYIAAVTAATALLTGVWRWVAIGLLAVQFTLFGGFALDHYSAGTIAAKWSIKKNKRILFEGANGVRVWVHKEKEYPMLEGVRKTVTDHSQPTDWLVCYPYQPGYNVMTNRRTYQHDIYQDNATVTANWSARTIVELQAMKPAVIIVDDRAINQNDGSRFSVWAKEAYDHIRKTYELSGTFDTVQVFTRPTEPKL